MFGYRIDILTPRSTHIYSSIHDGSVLIDEILGLVEIYNNTPPDRREIMNGTRIVDYYKRKGNK